MEDTPMSEGNDKAEIDVNQERQKDDLEMATSTEVYGEQNPAQDETQRQENVRLESIFTKPKHPDPDALEISKNTKDNIIRRFKKELAVIAMGRLLEDQEREIKRCREDKELWERINKEEVLLYGCRMMKYNQAFEGGIEIGKQPAHKIEMVSDEEKSGVKDTVQEVESGSPEFTWIETSKTWETITMDKIEVWESLVRDKENYYLLRCYPCMDADNTFKSKSTKLQSIINDWGQHGRTSHPEKFGDLPNIYEKVVHAFGIGILHLTKDLYDQFKESFKDHNGIPYVKSRGKKGLSKAVRDSPDEGSGDGSEGVSAEQVDTESITQRISSVRTNEQIAADEALAREIQNKYLEESRGQDIIPSTRSMKNGLRVGQSTVVGTGTATEKTKGAAGTSMSYVAQPVEDDDSDENYSPTRDTSPSAYQPSQSPPQTAPRLQQKRQQDQTFAAEADSEKYGSYEYEDEEKESHRRDKSAVSIPRNHNPKEPSGQEHPKQASKFRKSNERQSTITNPGKGEDRLSKNKNAEGQSSRVANSASSIPKNNNPKERSRQEDPKKTSKPHRAKEGQGIAKSDGKHNHSKNNVSDEESLFVPQGQPTNPNNHSTQNIPLPNPRDSDRPSDQNAKSSMSNTQRKASASSDVTKSRPSQPENRNSTPKPAGPRGTHLLRPKIPIFDFPSIYLGDQRQSSTAMRRSQNMSSLSATARSSASSSQARPSNKRSADASPSGGPTQKRQKPHEDSTSRNEVDSPESPDSPIREHPNLSTLEKRRLDEEYD
ncbi:hypothetical protein IFR05_012873 [Cadophora sp. M221]|nr:hypothetical protein IFR05_012873 [Cadophora sp. M221]